MTMTGCEGGRLLLVYAGDWKGPGAPRLPPPDGRSGTLCANRCRRRIGRAARTPAQGAGGGAGCREQVCASACTGCREQGSARLAVLSRRRAPAALAATPGDPGWAGADVSWRRCAVHDHKRLGNPATAKIECCQNMEPSCSAFSTAMLRGFDLSNV